MVAYLLEILNTGPCKKDVRFMSTHHHLAMHAATIAIAAPTDPIVRYTMRNFCTQAIARACSVKNIRIRNNRALMIESLVRVTIYSWRTNIVRVPI